MKNRICQSCGIPLTKKEWIATNKDGSPNKEFCIYCYKDGEYVDLDMTMQEMTELCIPYMEDAGMTEAEARKIMSETLPKLKRWAK
ncbi:transcriptional regulator [Actinomycetota bacterium]|nr:transcriptional regulator [Actinomycetota bacterium]